MRLVSVFTLGLAIFASASGKSWRPASHNHHQKPQPPFNHQLNQGSLGLPPKLPFESVDCSLPSNQIILHPHPSNCSLYIQCVYGAPLERPCAPGTEFGPAFGVCVHPEQSGCRAGQEPEPEEIEEPDEEPDDESEATPLPEEPETDSTWEPEIATDEPANAEGLLLDVTDICESEPSKNFLAAVPNNCIQFVECSIGDTVVRSCEAGQHFDSLAAQCLPGPCVA